MVKSKRRTLTTLEKKCITKFYFVDSVIFLENGTSFFKNLGFEKGLETILSLAIEEPIILKVNAVNEDNFTILFDENSNGKFEPIFIFKNGVQEF